MVGGRKCRRVPSSRLQGRSIRSQSGQSTRLQANRQFCCSRGSSRRVSGQWLGGFYRDFRLEPGTKYNMLVMGVRNGDAGKPIQTNAWTNPDVVTDIVVDTFIQGEEHFADVRFNFESAFKQFRVHLYDGVITENSEPQLIESETVDRTTATPDVNGLVPRFLASFQNLLPATEYSLRIETMIGDKSSYSPYKNFMTKDAIPPQQVVIVDQTTDSITVQYNESPDADSYEISVLDGESNRFVTSRKTSELVYEFINLTPGTNYKLAVASVSKGKRGIPSEEINAWTLPGLVQNPDIQFAHTTIQVAFEHAQGGVDYYDIIVESMDSTGSIVDRREIGPTGYPNVLLKSEFFYPSRQYKVKVTTVRNQYKNTFEKIGTMKTHQPVIISAEVDDDGSMKASWRMDEETYSDSITYDWRAISVNTQDVYRSGKGVTAESTRIIAFDRTQFYMFEVRAKLRNVWSPWISQQILLPNVPTTIEPTTVEPEIAVDKPVNQKPKKPEPQRSSMLTPPSDVCQSVSKKVDMIFVLDKSNSVGHENFQLMKQWLRGIVHELKIGPDATHVGVSVFNNLYNVVFDLKQYDSNADMINEINGILYKGRGTQINRALLRTEVEQLQRRLVRQDADIYLYLMTDGRDKSDAMEKTANELRSNHPRLKIVSIGLTEGIDYSELVKIASKPRKNHFFQLNSYQDLINDDRIKNLVLYHAGCNVEPPIDTRTGDDRYAADEVNPDAKVPVDLQVFGAVKQQRGSANKESGDVTMSFAKQRGSGLKTRLEVHLDQVEPDTREIVDTFVVDIQNDSDRRHTFSDLPLGYEYWGKARTYNENKKGDRTYSEFEEYKNIVHLRPEQLQISSEEHQTDEMVLRFDKPDGHIDQIKVTVEDSNKRASNSRKDKAEYYKFGSKNFNVTEDGNFVEVRLGADNGIEPAGSYDIEVVTISGNKEGTELELKNIRLPEMGKGKFFPTLTRSSFVTMKVTLPAGAAGADFEVLVYLNSEKTGKIEELGDGVYNVTQLEGSSQYRGVLKAYRILQNGQRYYNPEPFENVFWTRPVDIDCSNLVVDTTSSKISIKWPRDVSMDISSAAYFYTLEKETLTPSGEVAWNSVIEKSDRLNSATLYNSDGRGTG